MLYFDNDVIPEIKNNKNKVIELSGLPDAGTSSSAIFLAEELPGLSLYIGLKQNSPNLNVFSAYFEHKMDRVIFSLIESFNDENSLILCIDKFKDYVDYIFIDDFVFSVLYKPKHKIKRLMSLIYSKALENNIKIFIINQLRFDVFSIQKGKHPWNQKTPLKTLYFDQIRGHLDLRLKVKRDKDNDRDIFVSVDHEFNNKKSSKSETKLDDFLGSIKIT